MKNLRKLAILLLDDENGINEAAYNELATQLAEAGHTDILNAVKADAGRYYLGEDDAQDLLTVDFLNNFVPAETPIGEAMGG
jgi:hypothetical protein